MTSAGELQLMLVLNRHIYSHRKGRGERHTDTTRERMTAKDNPGEGMEYEERERRLEMYIYPSYLSVHTVGFNLLQEEVEDKSW